MGFGKLIVRLTPKIMFSQAIKIRRFFRNKKQIFLNLNYFDQSSVIAVWIDAVERIDSWQGQLTFVADHYPLKIGILIKFSIKYEKYPNY